MVQRPDPALRKLAAETGGGYFEMKDIKDRSALGTILASLTDQLHNQYVLDFTPIVLDGKRHDLRVSITRPGVSAHARKSYLAAKSK